MRPADLPSASGSHHWEQLGPEYSAGWGPPAKQLLSRQELDFVLSSLRRSGGSRALDIGIGNGRIVAALLDAGASEVYGVDVAQAMIEVCRTRFEDDPRVRGLERCDIAVEPLPFEEAFDLITAIRVLKYSSNWRDVVEKAAAALAPDGVLAFSMPNTNSLSRVSRDYDVPWYGTTKAELEQLARLLNLRILELTGFTKLPYFAYNRPRSEGAARRVVALDRVADRILGPRALTREFFVAAARA